ncbi:MAG TPA: HAMP domain-containing sensor histidine kinase [Bryobacteraceae bacterium]|jgi:signal transduction histidine kinase
MTPLQWLKPPGKLLLILFLITAASVSAVVWSGWRLLQQEGIVQAQRSQERLERSADRIAALASGALAETAERLESSPRSIAFSKGDVVLTVKENAVTVIAGGPLLYEPVPPAEPEANPNLFADAELLEFHENQPAAALEQYLRLTSSANPATRAGALLREARVLRNMGREEESRAAYSRLAEMRGVRVAGAPADLIARCALGDSSTANDLLRGRWRLSRGQFQFYWSESAGDRPPPSDPVALAEAARLAWDGRLANPAVQGQQTAWVGSEAFVFIWRGSPDRRTILVAKPESILKAAADPEIFYSAADAEGRIVYGRRDSARTVVRAASETGLPWTLYVGASPATSNAGLAAGRRYLAFGMSGMVLFMLLGAYFIARVIRREAETVRMQADFVSTVSHEFRSPLTSMRQLSEMLADGRVTGDRRQLYYETLVNETTRLQRLVEGLLHFGRMDAGARQYRFEELEAGSLVRRVVSELEPHASGMGRRIEASGAQDPCMIEADPEAISVALRNLLDNALKYSPDQPAVWVEWESRDRCIAIRVRDKGLGIPAPERKAIFRRFVRGSAAKSTNAKGSGLGLAMVRHIVAAHGGQIVVASEPGRGSEFTMLLPALGRLA